MDPIEKKAINEKLANAITAALDLEMAFKVYSYRITSPEQFIERVETIFKQWDEEVSRIDRQHKSATQPAEVVKIEE